MTLATKRLVWLGLGGLMLILLVASFIIGRRPTAKNQNINKPSQANHIEDGSLGISFNISQDFTPLSRTELLAMNPTYLYGFRSKLNAKTACFVSQTAITKPGKITAQYLKDGTFKAIKANYPTAQLNSWAPVKAKPAIFLDISYSGQGYKIDQPELVLVGTKNTIFAFCQTPSTDKASFKDDFTIFFSSLKLL